MPFFYNDYYQQLLELAPGIADYFQWDSDNEYWECTDLDNYKLYLSDILDEDPEDSPFFNWAGWEQIKSTQGGGNL